MGPKNVPLLRHGFQFAKHGFFPIEHGRACRHVILGPAKCLWGRGAVIKCQVASCLK